MAKTFEQIIVDFETEYPNTDFMVYFGPIRRPYDDQLIDQIEHRTKRKNLVLMLVTLGGDPDAAYRIGRTLQHSYKLFEKSDGAKPSPAGFFSVFVDSVCASAGTLITLGANEIIMGEFGELSPLDIQIRKPDDILERDSGLTPTQALDILERRSKSLFKQHFSQLRLDNEVGLTTRTAVEVASNITTGLLAPIYAQIDPMRLGEVERLMGITAAYGERLAKFNLKEGALARLLSGYSSHSFVIDRQEAEDDLFKQVSVPKPSLRALGDWLRPRAQERLTERTPINVYLTDAPKPVVPPNPPAETENEPETTGRDGAPAAREGAGNRAPRNRGKAAPAEAAPATRAPDEGASEGDEPGGG